MHLRDFFTLLFLLIGIVLFKPYSRSYAIAIDNSCLSQAGPLIVKSGQQINRYDTRSNLLALNTKIDARNASWIARWPVQDSFSYPVLLAGGPGGCFFGGEIRGSYPEDICDPPHTAGGSSCNPSDPNLPYLTWSYIHSSKALEVLLPNFTVENTRIHNYGDGIGIQAGAESFLLKGVHLSHIRDDCVENDYFQSGIIDDSLFDGCYEGFSTRPECTNCDGSNKIITIQNTLVRLEAIKGVYKNRGLIPGHDGFFKWDSNNPSKSPKLILRNNIFRADQQANNVGLGLPKGKVVECSNNIFVWLGPSGSIPQPQSNQDPLTALVNGKPCFTITTDRSVWDNAVADWLTRHQQTSGSPVTPTRGSVNPTSTTVPNQPTTTPLPTAPSTNPCMQAPTIACFLTWVNEFIGNYLTKYSDFNQDNTVNLIDYEIWRRGQNIFPTAPPLTLTPTINPALSPTPTQIFTLTPTPTQFIIQTPTSTPLSPTPTRTPTPIGPSPTNPPIGSAYRAFTADSYWNTPFPANAPIDPKSAQYIADSQNSSHTQNFLQFTAAPGTTQAFGHPIYWASNNDPIYTITPSKYGKTIQAKIPRGATPASGSDGSLMVYDLAGNVVIEFWQAKYNASTDTWAASSTKRYYLDSNGLDGSVAGSDNNGNFGNRGIPSSARAVRVDEVQAGAVNHRLECFWWATGTQTVNHYWPMSGDEGAKGGIVPEGIVIRIKPSVNLNSRGLSTPALVIAKALQNYGCMVGDNSGSGNRLGLELNETEWRNLGLTYDALSPLPWSDWEFIQGGYRP